METSVKVCKYCALEANSITSEYMKCCICEENVHLKCLRKGSVPGGLCGDVFYTFTCENCSGSGCEIFERHKMPWLQAIVLVLYHMQTKTPGLARKGFFHWKIHIATFINKYWDVLFNKDFKRKKKWMGTISGTLSHYNPHIFLSGTLLFNDQGWWTLTYPKLPPCVTVGLNSEFLAMKQKYKDNKLQLSDQEIFNEILNAKSIPQEFLSKTSVADRSLLNDDSSNFTEDTEYLDLKSDIDTRGSKNDKNIRKWSLLPSLEKLSEKPPKRLKQKHIKIDIKDDLASVLIGSSTGSNDTSEQESAVKTKREQPKFLDPLCHYNTSFSYLTNVLGMSLKAKLTGSIREDLILSPYSGLKLKPYIRRDCSTFPQWLQLMAEILTETNKKNSTWKLPPRSTIDYTYVQPTHIPAINSLCNEFFWPGIDLTECLQYPDFSCVALYKKLVIGFAFLVPNVKFNESYLSFIFTRPGWRNVGIGKFMIYHLIQTSLGKDITLHVSINNPALFLYQKFGFKVESVVLDFYDKYLQRDTNESKHAFFCRLER